MTTRYIRNTVILLKPEVTNGTDSVPTGLANALLIKEMSITPLDAKNIERDNIKGYFGANSYLVGPASVKCSLTVELSGSGTAATPPPWGNVLLAGGMAEGLLDTPDRVEYTPISSGIAAASIYYYDDGVLHKVLGSMGNPTLSAKVGEVPTLKFDFVGLDGGISAAANATPTLTAWKPPIAMTKANVVDITLGATYADGALTGGTAYPSNGIEIMWNNEVNFTANLTTEKVDIVDRKASGSFELELTAAEEVSFMGLVKANTIQSVALTLGTSAGYSIIIFLPAVQMTNPKKVDINKTRYCGYDLSIQPLVGNDEIRIITQ